MICAEPIARVSSTITDDLHYLCSKCWWVAPDLLPLAALRMIHEGRMGPHQCPSMNSVEVTVWVHPRTRENMLVGRCGDCGWATLDRPRPMRDRRTSISARGWGRVIVDTFVDTEGVG